MNLTVIDNFAPTVENISLLCGAKVGKWGKTRIPKPISTKVAARVTGITMLTFWKDMAAGKKSGKKEISYAQLTKICAFFAATELPMIRGIGEDKIAETCKFRSIEVTPEQLAEKGWAKAYIESRKKAVIAGEVDEFDLPKKA